MEKPKLSNVEVYDLVYDFAVSLGKGKAFLKEWGTREEYLAKCGGEKA